MEQDPDLKVCVETLKEALGTMQLLALYACREESDRLQETCSRMIRHIHILETSL
jgi:hypothetical protein